MTELDYEAKLAELDTLLNDPDVPMQPALVWSLLAEISHHDQVGLQHLPSSIARPLAGGMGEHP